MNASAIVRALTREPLGRRVVRELRPILRLTRPVDPASVWVLGQKKTGTSLAANFVSQGVYGRPAAIDLPVRRWLQRWVLPRFFERRPRAAVEMITRILREPVVKEPNLCYHIRELVPILDGACTVVYVTRNRVQHVRSFLDRILERSGNNLCVRSDLNFVWRDYLGELAPGSALNDATLRAMVRRLSDHFDAVDRTCLEAIGKNRGGSLVVRYEDIIQRDETSSLYGDLFARWPSFDWQRACRTLEVQHQPRGNRVVDEQLIAELVACDPSTAVSQSTVG